MLLDVRLPGISGFEVLRIVKENYSLIEVLMISAITEIETAVQAMKHGAYHYITKDFDYDQLRSLVRNASERQDLNRQVLTLSAQVADQTEREFAVGSSKKTRDIVDLVHKIAAGHGVDPRESGTGKSCSRGLVHREAGDSGAPFIAVNLAIPRSWPKRSVRPRAGRVYRRPSPAARRFELASNGTLFLDEIGDLRLTASQAVTGHSGGRDRACRRDQAYQDRVPADAATNVDLERPSRTDGSEDLYYRLNVIPIASAAAERIEASPPLAEFFLRRYNARFRKHIQGITDSRCRCSETYWWPGNIRELENLIERLVAVTDKDYISEEDLPPSSTSHN
jgi:DNA-binding NtrC family response regulator